ncbi:MAG: PaaI family thioesterase [Bacteroidia bacterium]
MIHPIIEKYIEYNNFGRNLGLHFTIIEPGVVQHTLTITKDHLATPKTAHGAVAAAMMDAVLGVAALSAVCESYRIVSTVEFKINYLNPALLGDELSGESIIEQKGNRIIVVSGTIKAVNRNVVIAKGIGTFNAYPAAKVGLME